MEVTAGHSNGWLCATIGPSYAITAQTLQLAHSSTCEFVIDRGGRLDELLLTDRPPEMTFEHASVHLPDLTDFDTVPLEERDDLGKKLMLLKQWYGVTRGALHPDLASPTTARWLTDLGMPFGIENMDRSKSSYRLVDEVVMILDSWHVPLVLDVQHAYENSIDSGGDGIELSVELARCAYTRLGITHLRVSGEIASPNGRQLDNHTSLVWATNTKAILQAVREVIRLSENPVTIILEGNYLPPPFPGDPIELVEAARIPELLEVAAHNMKRERDILMEAL